MQFILNHFLYFIIQLLLFLILWTILAWVAMRYIILAVNTFTILTTCNSCIKTFTIFFLALGFFTDTSRIIFSRTFAFYLNFSLFHKLFVLMSVTTTITAALRCAFFTWWKTLTIIFKAASFSASASSLLLPNFRILHIWFF